MSKTTNLSALSDVVSTAGNNLKLTNAGSNIELRADAINTAIDFDPATATGGALFYNTADEGFYRFHRSTDNGNAWNMDKEGRVTMPYQPCVGGRVSHYNTSGVKGGAGQCQLYDDGSIAAFSHGLSINNNSVTVPVDGVYHIQAEQLNIGDALYFNIYINGVSVKHGYVNTGGPFFGDYNVTATVYLNSNDIITFGYQTTASNRWEGPHSCFSVFKIA